MWEKQRSESLRRLLFINCVLNLTTIKVSKFFFLLQRHFFILQCQSPKKLECSLLITTMLIFVYSEHIYHEIKPLEQIYLILFLLWLSLSFFFLFFFFWKDSNILCCCCLALLFSSFFYPPSDHKNLVSNGSCVA